jgi:glycosyltransferase involved in cell wall biosynthesis
VKKMLYLTFNAPIGGIYSSQVADVIKLYRTDLEVEMRHIAFVSLRNYFASRKKIKVLDNKAIIIPMFPGIANWKWNAIILFIFLLVIKPHYVIARGVFSANIALIVKKHKRIKVCYDGRGAESFEAKEYNVLANKLLESKIFELEKTAVLQSDFRIAVSHKLVQYWKEHFGYSDNKFEVIPCTLPYSFTVQKNDSKEQILNEINYTSSDIILVYSGSNAGWQSFNLMGDYLDEQLVKNNNIKLLFLSGTNKQIEFLKNKYPERVKVLWVEQSLVNNYLSVCDYGLLIREKSITNKVASPLKFAEYLACGLKVIISESIGDYTDFVIKHNCGFVFSDSNFNLAKITADEKNGIKEIADSHFSKKSEIIIESYKKLLSL